MAASSFTVEGVYRYLALDFSARRAAERALSKSRRTSRYSERSEPSLRDEANPCAGRSGLVAFVRSRMRAARAIGRWLGGVRRGGSCRPAWPVARLAGSVGLVAAVRPAGRCGEVASSRRLLAAALGPSASCPQFGFLVSASDDLLIGFAASVAAVHVAAGVGFDIGGHVTVGVG